MSAPGPSGDGSRLIVLPRADQPLVSIVIPTINQAARLRRCLESLAGHLDGQIPLEIIVVMNAATDEIKSLVQQEVSGVLVSDSSANLGVAGGNNRGRSLARGRHIALLHDDTEIEPLWLERLVETAEARPDAGAVSSMILNPDRRLLGAGYILWKEALTSPPWGSGEARPKDYSTTRAVDYSGTCSILVRADTWGAIGGLDERLYPAYYVDVDLCMAIRKHGQIVLCDPRSRVVHHCNSSSKPGLRNFIVATNRALFAEKWKEDLTSYEPYAPEEPEALKRAHAHTKRLAHDLSEHLRPTSQVTSARVPIDPGLNDAWHVRKERELMRAYIEKLESSNTSLLKTLEKLESANATQLKASEERYATLKNKLTLKREEKVKLKAKCSRLRQKLEESTKRPLKWHQRLIRRIKKIGNPT